MRARRISRVELLSPYVVAVCVLATGVINIITRNPTDTRAAVEASYGTNNRVLSVSVHAR